MEPGKERAKAWVYSVINPLLEGLKIESVFLKRRNWTFRHYNEELEFIRPLASYVEFQRLPNWEDFTASNSAVKEKIEGREQRRDELRKKCHAAFRYLVDLTEFQQKVSDCLNVFMTDSPSATDPGGAVPNRKFHRVVAERIVNNIGELPDHYSDHEFWLRFRDDLLQFRKGPTFHQADQAGLELERHNDEVSSELGKVRSDLAAKHDFPWAQYPEENLALPGR